MATVSDDRTPVPPVRGSSPTMSIREKNLLKRRVNREHNSNFRAGYVHVNEEQLHKTGIRGRKRYFIYCLTCLMVLIVLLNIILTFLLLGVLNINRHGMEAIEFLPRGEILRFLGESDMGDVYPSRNDVGGLPGETLEVSGMNDNEVFLTMSPDNSSYLSVGPEGVTLVSDEGFKVIDPKTGEVYFSTDFEDQETLPEDVKNLKIDQLTVNRLTADINERFRVEGSKKVTLRGGEGVMVDGKVVSIVSADDIELITKEGGMHFYVPEGGDYILGNTKDFPKVPKEGGTREGYKLCVCSNNGLIFGVPAPKTCEQANEEEDPC